MAVKPSGRTCRQCGTLTARDNHDPLCGACQQKARDLLLGAPAVPAWFWDTLPMREALATQHMGRVVRAFRTHPYHGKPISQSIAATWFFLTQTQQRRIENGLPVQHLDRLMQWARTLRIPPSLLWFPLSGEPAPEDDPHRAGDSALSSTLSADPLAGAGEWDRMSQLLHRAFLQRGIAAVTLPAIGLDELKHIAAALTDARRYADEALVSYFHQQLDDCAAHDGARGPKQSIPVALGLVAAIESIASEAIHPARSAARRRPGRGVHRLVVPRHRHARPRRVLA
jgi:hypothetical protein